MLKEPIGVNSNPSLTYLFILIEFESQHLTVGQSSRGFALIVRLILCLVHQCFMSDFSMAFPVACINGLSEYTEVGKVVRFTYSEDLILDLGSKSIVELMPEWSVSPLDTCS